MVGSGSLKKRRSPVLNLMAGMKMKHNKNVWTSIFCLALIALAPSYAFNQDSTPPSVAGSETSGPLVYVIPLTGEVEMGLSSVIARGFKDARESGAAYLVVDMDTPGGRVDAALEICDLLLNSQIPTAVLVSGDATSAGAIIAICAEKIYMTGGTIGTAAPITVGEEGTNPAGEKVVSFLRAKVREYAEKRGRDAELCEAIIDQDLEITRVINGESVVISEKGDLLTMTASEALRYGFIDGLVHVTPQEKEQWSQKSRSLPADLLGQLGLPGAREVRLQEKPLERFARFLSSMSVSGFLLSIGLLGLFIEARTPGIGLPGILGIVCILLVFWGASFARLAGWEGPLLFGIGIILLTIEIFVTPGFGWFGVAGILCVLGSFVLTLLERGTGSPYFFETFSLTFLIQPLFISLIAAVVGAVGFLLVPVIFPFAAQSPLGRPLILGAETRREDGYVSADESLSELTGCIGTAKGDLRPAGIAQFGDKRIDVVTDGGYIPRGSRIEVLRVEGRRVVVRQAQN